MTVATRQKILPTRVLLSSCRGCEKREGLIPVNESLGAWRCSKELKQGMEREIHFSVKLILQLGTPVQKHNVNPLEL